jgi:soluble lytic murein transglycosylase
MRPRRRARSLAAFLALACAVGLSLGTARAAESPTGFGPAGRAGAVARANFEGGLSAADAQLYRRIFALQREGAWTAADHLLAQVSDDLLRGTLLAQRCLAASRACSGDEARQWLADYADLPDANRIHDLAKARSGHMPVPSPEELDVLRGRGGIDGGELWLRGLSVGHLSPQKAATANALTAKFRRALSQGSTLSAKRALSETELPKLLTATDYDRLRGALGFSYFLDGQDELALEWAAPAAARSGARAPQAAWTAGLANWRSHRFAKAETDFGVVAEATTADPWMQAAGAYWAGRAALHARRPQAVNGWLAMAAEHSRTFYGLIARRALGLPIGFGWDAETVSRDDRETLAQYPGGRRAMALIQIDEDDAAEAELRKLFPNVDPTTQQAIVAVADAGGVAGLSIRLSSEMQRREGVIYDNARYPVPAWKPADGWKIDRAVVYAFTRQESGFDARATSVRGARGLMQLMPATARAIAAADEVPDTAALLDPGLNLALGQRYLNRLLSDPGVGGNLFYLAAAYNGGPGNLAAWREKARADTDPLLFIEALPARETRRFIERIMANLWIYRLRLNQDTPSLDAVAGGHWPVYTSLDTTAPRLALRRKAD